MGTEGEYYYRKIKCCRRDSEDAMQVANKPDTKQDIAPLLRPFLIAFKAEGGIAT